jgi:class 3 adenylate cyclase
MAEQTVERRLAAVLAADVVGYSQLMAADEEGTLARLNSCRRELWEPTIAEHRAASSNAPAMECWSSLAARSTLPVAPS